MNDRGARRRACVAATIVVALGSVGLVGPEVAAAPGDGEPAVELVVTGDTLLDARTVARVTAGTGRITSATAAIGTTVIEVPASRASAALRALDATPGVDTAGRDQQVRAFDRIPNDPFWPSQSSLREVGAPAAWSVSVGSPSVVIAVVDSGVDDVADLAGRVLPGYDFVNGDSDPADDFGHGTAAALVAASAGDDAAGTAGMCWSCRILPVKVLDSDGFGSMSEVAEGIVWAADQGADVINLSLGGRTSEPAVANALAYAYARDVVVVASAGNDGRSERSYPAAETGVIAVAGVANGTRTLQGSSRRGAVWVDTAAPWCNWVVDGVTLDDFCGTSSAAPVVSGTVALLRAARPAADRQMVATALLTTADFAPTAGLVGYGILDAGRALGAIGSVAPGPTPPPPDVTPPTAALAVPGGYVGGVARVSVTAEDDQRVALDEVFVDGIGVATATAPAPVATLEFDTRRFGDGPHTVVGRAVDGAGQRTDSAPATVVIDNVNPVGLLTSPTNGARLRGSFVARVFVTDPNGIMGTFLVANDRVVGGFLGSGWGQATVPVTRSGPIRVVAITVDNAGRISGTNQAVVVATPARRR